MFKKLLVANRGEIAVRIIKTCQRLGIKTVAVYSKADEDSLHVKLADEAYYVGGARVNESYLNMNAILQVAIKSGAEAIHPGYGFLSENPVFADKVEKEGITFIGPKSEIIQKMGNKIEARTTMQEADVPIIPGRTLHSYDERTVLKAAREISFPLMIKAAAGGGGIGMQRVEHEKELKNTIPTLIKKAETFFGSTEIYMEKCIENARHIEAQIVGDKMGNIVCIGDRDCSIQRRHQKIVEEAPATFLSIKGREKLYEKAVKAGKAIHYSNVGTVEFLVDDEENVYFLEMNTRLQVEHPVTEETTGIDLVELQLQLAAGMEIPQIETTFPVNHAIEVRIYAEDPNTFFPSPGKLTTWEFPQMENIRYDFGVRSGTEVTPFYDPMLGKVIATANLRQEAIQLLIQCLEEAIVEGIKTNIPMLLHTLKNEQFHKGNVMTNFVQKELKIQNH